MELIATFKVDKETKGTFRYKEVSEPGKEVIGMLYVKKTAMEKSYDTLTVTVKGA